MAGDGLRLSAALTARAGASVYLEHGVETATE
jgi:hypothetical protein